MAKVIVPSTETELAEIVSTSGPFMVEGGGSKRGLGRSTPRETLLSLSKFKGIVAYEPEELILEAGSATPLSEVLDLLEEQNQMLAFEPPEHGHLWNSQHDGSIGGLLAAGLAGPRRIKSGSARDHVLGVRGVTGRGEMFKAGARVVKNVTGYDMPKLMAGSFGTLAVFSTVTLKVLPRPETEETVFIPRLTDSMAIARMSEAMQSSAEVSAAAHVPGEGTYLRFEGIAVSVAARRDKFVSSLRNNCELLDEDASQKHWLRIRDCRVFTHEPSRVLWRVSVAPSDGARVVAAIAAKIDISYYFDWAGGLIWLSCPARGDGGADVIRSSVPQGHATLYVAPSELRQRVSVFQPQAPAVAALTKRLKHALDPQAKLNPGRMYEGV